MVTRRRIVIARDIGKHLQAARSSRELTLRELEELSGVSIGSLSTWERGLHWPSIPMLLPVLRVFKEGLWIVGREEEQ